MTDKKPFIFRLAVPVFLNRLFDYLAPDNINVEDVEIGVRVKVPFAGGEKIAILIEISNASDIETTKLKTVLDILDEAPLLPAKDMQLLHWLHAYYHYPIGHVFCNSLPILLKKGEKATLKTEAYYLAVDKNNGDFDDTVVKKAPKQLFLLEKLREYGAANATILKRWDKNWRTPLTALLQKQLVIKKERYSIETVEKGDFKEARLQLNAEQQKAVDAVVLESFGVFLLEGVTGSGKTEVYMQLIAKVLARGQQVMVLLPEISLTPQLELRFHRRFNVPIVISHSKLTKQQRLQSWLAIQTGHAKILLGTRSALFTPLKTPGLLILDEEHDASFKQQEGLRFSARDVAVMKAKIFNIPILLGSATPSLESLANVEKKRYRRLHLPERAGNAKLPQMLLLDIRNKQMQQGLSAALLMQIKQTLSKGEQALIFLNRRGFAPTLICHSCGWVARCQHCDANLVIHQRQNQLRCHHCGHQYLLIKQCPACQKNQLNALGLGTERVEQLLQSSFPDKRIVRLDTETTQRKGMLEAFLAQINRGEVDIILGTQMLAKGHHFPNVTLVVLLDIDSGLFSMDFRAPEKLAQLITQVSGRAGRGDKTGKVLLQTRQPNHPLLTTLIQQGYAQFAKQTLAERKVALLPPYSYQALLRVQAVDEIAAETFFKAIKPLSEKYNHYAILVLGPVPAPMAKREGNYHFQLLFQGEKRVALQHFLSRLLPEIEKLKEATKVRWSLDVDPIDLY